MLYEDTRAMVLSPNGEKNYFKLVAGALQGDTLAPYTFIIVLDYTMRQAIGNDEDIIGFKLDKKRSRRQKPAIITDFDFADDIELMTEEINQAQEFLHSVQNSAARTGLHLNADKTKFMCFNQKQEPGLNT